jgi:TatD DNase family protein
MIDSHTHRCLCEGEEAELVSAAAAAGVERMLTVGLDEETNEEAVASAHRHEGVFAAVGRHPNQAGGFDDAAAEAVALLAGREAVRAIGETGLDFYRDSADADEQRRAFAAQIEIAVDAGLPIVIHCRDPEHSTEAIDEVIATLDARAAGHTVILHCFSAPGRVAEAVERRWYCSFAGNSTYPRSGPLREAAAEVPEDRILVETDAPYLSPQRLRGKRNMPANVVATAEVIARARGVGYEELERTVDANARALFGW